MKMRRFMSMYMFLALVFSNAIAMMPDNPDNNKRKREDGNSFEMNKKREIDKKGEPLEEKVKPNDSLLKFIEDFNCDNFFEWESNNTKEKEEIIEKVPENSSKDNQNFNSNNAQNNFQENGSKVPTQEEFNAQIIPKPIVPKAVEKFNYEAYLEWEKSNERNLQGNQKINGNNVVNNIVINGPVFVSTQQQPSFSPEQIQESLLPINSQKKESIKKNKTQEVPIDDIYVIKKPDGSYYCSICKRSFEDRGYISTHIRRSAEHRYNKLFGKNVFKIPLTKKLVCPFSSCNKEFNDIDDFVDHVIEAHVKGKMCPFSHCPNNVKVDANLRIHIARYHTQSDMFYTCPGCPGITCKCSSDIINHIHNCDNFKKRVEQITKQNQPQQNNENGFICEK